jgi:uncharacterized membrane protein AbrB (regulator of aidB expression)
MKRLTHERCILNQYEKEWPQILAILIFYICIFAGSAPFLFLFAAYTYNTGLLAFTLAALAVAFEAGCIFETENI